MNSVQPSHTSTPLRAAIVTSNCGGSLVAARAIENAVKGRFPQAQCSTAVIDDLWPGAAIQAYDRYLSLAEGCYFGIIKFLTVIEKIIISLYENHFAQGITNKILSDGKKPDILISTTPIINSAVLKVARKQHIPVFVVTADMNTELYAARWPKEPRGQAPYRFGVYYSCHEVASTLPPTVDRDKLVYTGGFVKEEFTRDYSEIDKTEFKRELQLPEDKKIVSLMMGSLGGMQIYSYVRRLLQGAVNDEFIDPAHFVIFCAKNEALKQRVESLAGRMGFKQNEQGQFVSEEHPNVSFSFLGFSKEVHKYYAISSGLITKPGGGSVNEAVAQNLPLILDDTIGQFPWEALNGKTIELYGMGSTLRSLRQLPERINTQCLSEQGHAAIVARYVRFKQERPGQFDFQRVVADTVGTLLKEAKSAEYSGIEQKPFDIKEALIATIYVYNLIAEALVRFSFFSEFVLAKSSLLFEQKKALLARDDVTPIEGVFSPESNKSIDALYFSAPEDRLTGNIIVNFLAKPYQKMHPRNMDHLLQDGADVVVFNPTRADSKTMTEDAKALIRRLRQENPEARILFSGYCIGAHVALRVAKDLEAENPKLEIPVVIDRGFESSYALTRKVTLFAPMAKHLFQQKYDLKKDQQLRGRVCSIGAPQGSDQLLHDRKGRINFLQDLRDARRVQGDTDIDLPEGSDHYTRWDAEAHNKVKQFMHEQGFLRANFRRITAEDLPVERKPSFGRRVLMPLFL